ncbi:leucine-rich repeat receptor protein kinase EMS1-like [Pyrus x bretschneideri]|uniref:leucine-rich repeat receptor protein kinase EMS1-like n=1 Tax=Pyrus x bretschneideri TaxID=225117 RepID=UPI00202FEAFD|nr:leucine-rich repeat receptor protein kinase EMS1-like [Pyrus x bretschneideri]
MRVLSLSNTLLSGLADQSLAKLQSLSVIQLDGNHISGPIPGFFANLSNLREFSWNANNVFAPFPGFFANFSKLTSLSLSYCSLQGIFPKEIFQVPFRLLPGSIGNLKHLERIDLFNCSFTGSIPKSMEDLTQFVYLEMSSNLFNGAIISIQWENVINLAELHLADNLLEGSIPPTNGHVVGLSISNQSISNGIDNSSSLFDLEHLQTLNLADKKFSYGSHMDKKFSYGSHIPSAIGKFTNLREFSWDGNNVPTPFPGFFVNFAKLTSLSLSGCSLRELHGSLPEFPNNGSLQSLVLHATNFSRLLPGSIGNLKHLERIDLFNCNFTGSIPKSMENLTQLVYLDMSSNLFNGAISSIQWENLINLADLHLADNLPEGSVPPSLFSLPLLQELGLEQLSLSSNNFSAFPFNSPHHLKNLTNIDLSYNSLQILYNGTNSSYSSFPQIGALNLASNKLTKRPVPFNNPTAGEIDIHSNQLQGEIPYTFGNVYYLDCSSNHFSSSIPADIGLFCWDIKFLSLSNNNLHGIIPESICNGVLDVIDLSNNSLSGKSNKFYGGIACPKTNGTWPVPQVIDLAHNNLSGEIPRRSLTTWLAMRANADDSLGKARHLEFSGNNFNGPIPKEMGEFKSLYFLNLSSNSFTGLSPPQANGNHPNSRDEIDWDLISVEIGFVSGFAVVRWTHRGIRKIPVESPNLSMLFHNLTDLIELYLDGVNISAQGIKWCQAISSSHPNERVLSLSDTLLSGPVDQSLAKLQSLSVIQLDKSLFLKWRSADCSSSRHRL